MHAANALERVFGVSVFEAGLAGRYFRRRSRAGRNRKRPLTGPPPITLVPFISQIEA
jgi:hypothetical protein